MLTCKTARVHGRDDVCLVKHVVSVGAIHFLHHEELVKRLAPTESCTYQSIASSSPICTHRTATDIVLVEDDFRAK